MRFGSLFSGVGGFDRGFELAGMHCEWQVEFNQQCQSVLRRHWPDVRLHGDVTSFPPRTVEVSYSWRGHPTGPFAPDVYKDRTREEWTVDVICGGSPCQDLSVAGKRAGLAGERSGLWWEFRRILAEFTPRWVCIENVPGLLSSNEGRDMGAVVGSLGELGYGWSYRVLDSQWFGVPQRRRRVFIVGCLGDARSAAKVLFEPEGVPWDSPPRREAKSRIAASLTRGADSGGKGGAAGRRQEDDFNIVTHTLKAEGHDASEDGTGRGVPLIAAALRGNYHCDQDGDETKLVAYRTSGNCGVTEQGEITAALNCATDPNQNIVGNLHAVRRLTPTECERLQGFPDNWTLYGADGEQMSDSARYRMLGNAVTVNVLEWIGRRIMQAEKETRCP